MFMKGSHPRRPAEDDTSINSLAVLEASTATRFASNNNDSMLNVPQRQAQDRSMNPRRNMDQPITRHSLVLSVIDSVLDILEEPIPTSNPPSSFDDPSISTSRADAGTNDSFLTMTPPRADEGLVVVGGDAATTRTEESNTTATCDPILVEPAPRRRIATTSSYSSLDHHHQQQQDDDGVVGPTSSLGRERSCSRREMNNHEVGEDHPKQ